MIAVLPSASLRSAEDHHRNFMQKRPSQVTYKGGSIFVSIKASNRSYPVMVIYQTAPVKQIEHGLIAEQRLLIHLWVVGNHGRACSQLDGLVYLCPRHLLQPHLLRHMDRVTVTDTPTSKTAAAADMMLPPSCSSSSSQSSASS